MLLFKPRGVTSNDPKYAGNSSIMTLQELLAYRDTWTERVSEGFSLGSIFQKARSERDKPVVAEKLSMTENGFKVKDREDMDESERAVRMVQSTLNKLTKSNFDVLVKPILTREIVLNEYVIGNAVRLIYEKALVEPVFVGLYASLCHEMSMCARSFYQQGVDTDNQKRKVQLAIVEKCQQMFDSAHNTVSLSKEEAEKLHKRNVTNIKFTGELFLKSLISHKVVQNILSSTIYSGITSDVDLELVINLLEVIGKLYEEKNPEDQEKLWKKLEEFQEDRKFSNRIRFLLQNLIDRRVGGWEPRAAESAEASDPKAEQQQQQQPPPPPPPQQQQQHMVHPAGDPSNRRVMHHHQHQRDSNTRVSPSMGKRVQSYQELQSGFNGGQWRVKSCNELSSSMPPPPPPPVPGQGFIKEQYLENEPKLVSFARPPEALTIAVQKNIISMVRDAVLKGTPPQELSAHLEKSLPGENGNNSLMSSVFVILFQYITSPDESEKKIFLDALVKGEFEKSILCRGFAWCLTKMISDRGVRDFSHSYYCFVSAIVCVPGFDLIAVIKDVMSRTANYLDSLYDQCGTSEWEEDFIKVWEILLSDWMQKRGVQELQARSIIECVASVPQRTFMRSIMPDFVAEMICAGLFREDQLKEWRCENESNTKYRNFIEDMNQLYA